MYRQALSFIAAIVMLFGLFVWIGQSFASEESSGHSCVEATYSRGAISAPVSDCDHQIFHYTCHADGSGSFIPNTMQWQSPSSEADRATYPVKVLHLVGSFLSPDTPPPIAVL